MSNEQPTIHKGQISLCCICGETFHGYGNNPWPVKEEGVCCNECNLSKVFPARWNLHFKPKGE